MELRIWSLFGLFVTLAVVSQCSVNAHTMQRRSAYYDDDFLGDEGIDDEAQKDEGNDIPMVGTIETQGIEYTTAPGESVRLECKVNPQNVPVVNWYKVGPSEDVLLYMNTMRLMKKGNPLFDRTSILNENGMHDFTINNISLSDAGDYRCQLEQAEKTSIVHRLTVKSQPNIISFWADGDTTVPEGSQIKLTCEVEGTPPAKIVWSRTLWGSKNANGRLTERDAEFTLNSVLIKNIKFEHSGSYYCYAFNSLGSAQREINITVLERPHAHIHKTQINTGVGVHAVFQCSTQGRPVPQISWFKDNVPVLVDNKRFMISTENGHSNLTVVPAGANDFGTYTCVAQNEHGIHNKSAELVQRPVIDEVDVQGLKLAFTVHSHLPLEQVEIQLVDESGNMMNFNVPTPEVQDKSLDFTYEVKDMVPGKYQAFIRAKNEKDWTSTEPISLNILTMEPINIQKSQILGGGSNAHSIRHSTTLLSSAFMYLLIRML